MINRMVSTQMVEVDSHQLLSRVFLHETKENAAEICKKRSTINENNNDGKGNMNKKYMVYMELPKIKIGDYHKSSCVVGNKLRFHFLLKIASNENSTLKLLPIKAYKVPVVNVAVIHRPFLDDDTAKGPIPKSPGVKSPMIRYSTDDLDSCEDPVDASLSRDSNDRKRTNLVEDFSKGSAAAGSARKLQKAEQEQRGHEVQRQERGESEIERQKESELWKKRELETKRQIDSDLEELENKRRKKMEMQKKRELELECPTESEPRERQEKLEIDRQKEPKPGERQEELEIDRQKEPKPRERQEESEIKRKIEPELQIKRQLEPELRERQKESEQREDEKSEVENRAEFEAQEGQSEEKRQEAEEEEPHRLQESSRHRHGGRGGKKRKKYFVYCELPKVEIGDYRISSVTSSELIHCHFLIKIAKDEAYGQPQLRPIKKYKRPRVNFAVIHRSLIVDDEAAGPIPRSPGIKSPMIKEGLDDEEVEVLHATMGFKFGGAPKRSKYELVSQWSLVADERGRVAPELVLSKASCP